MERPTTVMKRGIAALALTLLATGVALAHGPTRQKVEESIEIDVPPAQAWEAVGDFQGWHRWLPMVETTRGEGGNEEGAVRTLVLAGGGGEVNEELKRRDADRMRITYRIPLEGHDMSTLPVSNYQSTVAVTANEAGGSTVTWRGAFYRGYMNNDPPDDLNDEAAVSAVTGLYQAGLKGLKEFLEGQ